MAFTTLGNLVEACVALDVSGVKTQQAYRPRVLAQANMPLLYTRLPRRNNQISTLSYGQDLRRATIEIVILVEMYQLGTQEGNDALTTELIDALGDALEENAADLGMDSYDIVPEEDTVGEGQTAVQAIIATVEVSG